MERQEDDKLVVYSGHRLIVLGQYAAEIWRLCDGKHTLNDMVEMVGNKYSVPKEKATEEIIAFLNQLAGKGLVKLNG